MTFKNWIKNSYYHFNKEDVFSINCDSSGIDSLEGIEEYTNLEILQCCNNDLKDIKGIEKMKNIKMLTLYSNKLESLKGIEKLPNLTRLYINGNNLSPREHMRIPSFD